jgi:hypothetical protein
MLLRNRYAKHAAASVSARNHQTSWTFVPAVHRLFDSRGEGIRAECLHATVQSAFIPQSIRECLSFECFFSDPRKWKSLGAKFRITGTWTSPEVCGVVVDGIWSRTGRSQFMGRKATCKHTAVT